LNRTNCSLNHAKCFLTQAVTRAALELHKECDVHGSAIIRRFAEFRNLKRLANDINRKGSSNNELPDPRAVESYLEELLVRSKHIYE
jgi:hypothetical protein